MASAATTPQRTPSRRSTKTITMKVTAKTAPSAREWRQSLRKDAGLSIRKATEKSTAASAGMGMRSMTDAVAYTATRRASAWTIAARRVFAPAWTLAPERAMTPVTGMPPKKAHARLPRPCPMSSWSGSLRALPGDIFSTAVADSRVSSEASAKTSRVEPASEASEMPAGSAGRRGAGSERGISPMVATSRPKAATTAVERPTATRWGGTRGASLGRP